MAYPFVAGDPRQLHPQRIRPGYQGEVFGIGRLYHRGGLSAIAAVEPLPRLERQAIIVFGIFRHFAEDTGITIE